MEYLEQTYEKNKKFIQEVKLISCSIGKNNFKYMGTGHCAFSYLQKEGLKFLPVRSIYKANQNYLLKG